MGLCMWMVKGDGERRWIARIMSIMQNAMGYDAYCIYDV